MADLAANGVLEQDRRLLTIKNVDALRRLIDDAQDS